MQYLIFSNPGEIDIRGATIAGLSAKDDPNSAIGYFGTGLKYAIAQVLANGGEITIWSGTTEHSFYLEPISFRGSEHNQIIMLTEAVGKPTERQILGFTTHYGSKWQPWQIFRELYANALDEGGRVARAPSYSPAAGHTTIAVSNWPALAECFFERDKIILPTNLDYEGANDDVAVADVATQFLYYKGVRVAVYNALFTWNFKQGLQLTEDRTVEAGSWDIAALVNNFIISDAPEGLVRLFLTAPEATFEANAFSWMTAPKRPANCSKAFADVATELWRASPTSFKQFKDLALAHKPEFRATLDVTLTRLQQGMLDRAKALVSKMGFAAEVENIPISVQHLGGRHLGLFSEGHIYLSPLVFDQGTKQVVSTLYEECTHAKLGYRDCCYEMQTHLFNSIISLWEELLGEPC